MRLEIIESQFSKMCIASICLSLSLFLSGCGSTAIGVVSEKKVTSLPEEAQLDQDINTLKLEINSASVMLLKLLENFPDETFNTPIPEFEVSKISTSIKILNKSTEMFVEIENPITSFAESYKIMCTSIDQFLYNIVLQQVLENKILNSIKTLDVVNVAVNWNEYSFDTETDKYGNPIPPHKIKSFGVDHISFKVSEIKKINESNFDTSFFNPNRISIPGSRKVATKKEICK